jgi:diguanylate cyclase
MPPRSAAWAANLAPTVVNLTPRGPLDDSDSRYLPVLPGTDPAWAAGRLQGCRELELPAGTVLLRRGRRTRNVYLVAQGLLGVFAEADDEAPHSRARVGEIVGELGVLSGEPATMDVRAITATRVVEIDEDTFFCLIYESHMFAINVLLLLSSRLRTSASVIATFADHGRALERAVSHDALTGVHSRRWLDETLLACVSGALRDNQPLALLMVDVDRFKLVNDTYGHADGDRVLTAVAAAIAGSLRQADLVARFGGEEFVVVLPGADGPRALVVAERLRAAVAGQPVTLSSDQVAAVTVSVGLAQLRAGDDPELLLAHADRALYRAKAAGRNRVEVEPEAG